MKTKKKLNVNTIYTKSKKNIDIKSINKIINHNIDSKFNVSKYLGRGISGHLFLVDNNTETKDEYPRLLCKIIEAADDNIKKRILIEIGMLNYLSKTDVNKFINPCIKFGFVGDKIFTFFPAYSGYKLKTLKNKLLKKKESEFITIITYIIKHLLLALSSIHKNQIAHQNLDDTSVVIDINLNKTNNDNVSLKIIDFGLGCGVYNFTDEYMDILNIKNKGKNKSNIENKTKTNKKTKKITNNIINTSNLFNKNNDIIPNENIYFEKCLTASKYFISTKDDDKVLKDIKKIFKNLNNKKYIKLAQSYDVWCCGIIIYDLLCSYSLGEPYINASELDNLSQTQAWYNDFKFNFNRKIMPKLSNYTKILEKYMLVPIKERKSANYCLEQIILIEKFDKK